MELKQTESGDSLANLFKTILKDFINSHQNLSQTILSE